MPTPIEWADEPQRMSNIRDGVGCPHGRLDYCYVCEQLEIEARQVFENVEDLIEEIAPECGATYVDEKGMVRCQLSPPHDGPHTAMSMVFNGLDAIGWGGSLRKPTAFDSGEVTPEGGEFVE